MKGRNSARAGDQNRPSRLKPAGGHLDGIVMMVKDDTYCVQVIKHIVAPSGAFDRVSRIELRNHREQCVVEPVRGEHAGAAVTKLMDILSLCQEVA